MYEWKLKVSEDPHSAILVLEGGCVVGLVGLGGTISHVHFEICRVNKLLGQTSPYVLAPGWARHRTYPSRTALHPRGSVSSGIPMKVLSHLRIPEQGPARAYRTDTAGNAVLSKARAPLAGWTPCRAPCASPRASEGFFRTSCPPALATSWHHRYHSRCRGLNSVSAHWLFRLGSKFPSSLELKRVQSSRDFVLILSKQSNLKA